MSQAAKDAAEQLKADINKVMSTPEGRRFVTFIMEGVCEHSRPTFLIGDSPRHSDWQQGRREVAVKLDAYLLNWAPKWWQRRWEEWAAENVRKASEKQSTTPQPEDR